MMKSISAITSRLAEPAQSHQGSGQPGNQPSDRARALFGAAPVSPHRQQTSVQSTADTCRDAQQMPARPDALAAVCFVQASRPLVLSLSFCGGLVAIRRFVCLLNVAYCPFGGVRGEIPRVAVMEG